MILKERDIIIFVRQKTQSEAFCRKVWEIFTQSFVAFLPRYPDIQIIIHWKARKDLERLKKKLTHRRWLRAIADNPENFAEDNDVDELVKWAEVLDVDQYKDNWMNLVTLPSL